MSLDVSELPIGLLGCDCGPQLREALAAIVELGGYVVYLRQKGRGIGLYSKMDAYRLQNEGLDTFAANRALDFDDERDFHVAAQMLRALGFEEINLLTNNTRKVEQLVSGGIRVAHGYRSASISRRPTRSTFERGPGLVTSLT